MADTGYVGNSSNQVVRSGYGLCWHNGTGPAAAVPNECEPGVAPVTLVAAPAPKAAAPIVAAPQPAADKVKLDADTLFDFNKADLRPAGRTALDDFLVKMKDIEPEAIIAVGHADRFGSSPFNQRLSEKRVESVKAYLIGKGMAENRVTTSGKGETEPVTKADDCKGAKSAKDHCLDQAKLNFGKK